MRPSKYRIKHSGCLVGKSEKRKCESLSRVGLFVILWTVARQAPVSMGFSRQEYWNGWPFPSPGDLPDRGIEPGSPALQVDSSLSEPPGEHAWSENLHPNTNGFTRDSTVTTFLCPGPFSCPEEASCPVAAETFPSLRSFPFFPLVFPKRVSAPKAGPDGPHTHLLLPCPRQTLLTHHGLLPTEQDSAWDSSSEPGVSGPQELNRGEKDGVGRWSGAGRCPEKTRVAARQAEAHGT